LHHPARRQTIATALGPTTTDACCTPRDAVQISRFCCTLPTENSPSPGLCSQKDRRRVVSVSADNGGWGKNEKPEVEKKNARRPPPGVFYGEELVPIGNRPSVRRARNAGFTAALMRRDDPLDSTPTLSDRSPCLSRVGDRFISGTPPLPDLARDFPNYFDERNETRRVVTNRASAKSRRRARVLLASIGRLMYHRNRCVGDGPARGPAERNCSFLHLPFVWRAF
jgi:hypothetical protein